MRIDVKGSPALRFLNHNAYAIADSSNVCCVDGQEFIDPALILARMAEQAIGNGLAKDDVNYQAGNPLITPFVAEGDVNWTLTGSSTAANTLTTGGGADIVTGGADNDIVVLGAGADVYTGTAGTDSVTGNDGADTIALAAANDNVRTTIVLSLIHI